MPVTATVAAVHRGGTVDNNRRQPARQLKRSNTRELRRPPTSTRIEAPVEAPTQDDQVEDDFPSVIGASPIQAKRGRRVQPSDESPQQGSFTGKRKFSITRSGAVVSLADTVTYTKHLQQSSKKPWFIIDPRNSKLMDRWDVAAGAHEDM